MKTACRRTLIFFSLQFAVQHKKKFDKNQRVKLNLLSGGSETDLHHVIHVVDFLNSIKHIRVSIKASAPKLFDR